MRETRNTRIALVASLALAALAVVVATGGPAFSEEPQTAANAADAKAEATAESEVDAIRSGHQVELEATQQARDLDAEGYEWCASRTTANRYLWSHRPS